MSTQPEIKLPPLPIKLPPLPEPVQHKGHAMYAGSQMTVYARQCVLADRAARADAVSDPKSLDAIRAGMVKDGWEIMPDGKMKPPKGYTAIAQTGSTSDQANRPPTTDVMPDWLTISKPAQVSNIRFRAGTKVRLIVEAAQRYWEYKNEPSREAERIKEAGKRVAALVGVVNGPGHLAQWRHVIDQLPMDGTVPPQERGADDE